MTDNTLKLLLDGAKTCGKYDFPAIRACISTPNELIPWYTMASVCIWMLFLTGTVSMNTTLKKAIVTKIYKP